MRRIALIGSLVALLVAASVAYAATGTNGTRVSLSQALAATAHATSQRDRIDVHITKDGMPLTLHIRGESAPSIVSVHLKMANIRLPGGGVLPGASGAELLDGPFLYERAPDGIVVNGTIRWLRVPVAELRPDSPALETLHALTPAALLHVVAESHATPRRGGVFAGPVAYDDPVVRAGLAAVTGGIEFRGLHVTVRVGRDGLVHGLVITGRTADRSRSLRIVARLYAFGGRVSVTPPALGTFLDRRAQSLAD